MGKNKLEKFAEMATLPNVYEYPFSKLIKEGVVFPYKGRWQEEVFKNQQDIVLELGCGRGEYTLAMARHQKDKNFIGVDIKGNRMWSGATEANALGLENAVFLRTQIELLEHFFEPEELHEIWLTFPDPQMKKVNKRLTSVRFLQMYKKLLQQGGLLHLKTDSRFLYTFTKAVAQENDLELVADFDNIDQQVQKDDILRQVQTYYEKQWRERQISIKYLCLKLDQLSETAQNPDIEIEPDSYRSFNRERRSQLKL